jgi:phosphoglycolate phosphatase-like HAD superfamily hydrolase
MGTVRRLALWNVDHTLVDVGRVTREAYAEAFQRVTRRPLVRLAPTAGRTESEIIFDTLAFNDIVTEDHHLPEFTKALAEAFAARRRQVREYGRVLPGAREALVAVSRLPGIVQSVMTGSIKPNAVIKLTELGLDKYLDFEIGGYGSEVYSRAALIELARGHATRKYVEKKLGVLVVEPTTLLIADSVRDVQAAKIARVPIVAVASGTATAAELRGAGADMVLPALDDTAAVVRAVDRLTSDQTGDRP